MNKQAFLNLLKNPDSISAKDLEGLEEVISNFPFCQVAHILAAKGANDQGKMLSDLRIRKAAGYAAERRTLKKIIKTKPSATLAVKQEPKLQDSLVGVNEPISITAAAPFKASPIVEISAPNKKSLKEDKISFNENSDTKAEDKKENIKAEISEANLETVILPKEENKPVLVSSNDNFFSQLEENLSQLQLTKAKAKQDLTQNIPLNVHDKKEEKPVKSEEKPPLIPVESKEVKVNKEDVKPLPVEVQEIKNKNTTPPTLLTESLKEHSEETNIFSSRLDEVIEDKSTTIKPIINEADLLLNYLAFLNSHKSIVIKDKKKTEDIIEEFIKKDPSIPYMNNIKLPEEHEDKASQSYQLKGAFVSENMAKIYIKQEKFDKAIEIYQQLMLKNPEKKPYFVTQIEKLKSNS